jgi:hypothetical protein
VHEANLQRDAGLLDLRGDEIAAVVDVENLGEAADRPSRIGLAPDRLVKRQRGVRGRRRVRGRHVARDRAAVVVHHHRQPGPDRFAARIPNEDVEHGMVGLPHLVGRGRVAPVHEFVPVAVAGRIGGDGDPCGPNLARHVCDDGIARPSDTACPGLGRRLAMDGGDGCPGATGRRRTDHRL